ncbi:MAG TPA: hypothetical protein VJK09_03190 [Candidatus Paceibacterota bacterium]
MKRDESWSDETFQDLWQEVYMFMMYGLQENALHILEVILMRYQEDPKGMKLKERMLARVAR